MPTITAGRLADDDKIRSYSDIVAAHHALCLKVVAGNADRHALAADRVESLGRLYRKPAAVTDAMREAAEKALAAVHQALRAHPTTAIERIHQFDVADAWLDRLSLLVNAPTDGR